MIKKYLVPIFVLALFASGNTHAQIVGANGFLQGAWLEIGECNNAAFGVQAGSPAGYHPHAGFGTPLAEVYDYGHDGWTVGAPAYMGDYTYPGSPFEGWEIQMNGTRSQQYASPAYSFTPYSYSGACTMTPSPLTYSNIGGIIRVNWAGNFTSGASTLNIKQETRVDTFGSAVVVTAKIYNTSAAAASNVYYWRSCDPDNDETWPGGGFSTNNVVNYQNDVDHRVEVTGTGLSPTHPPMSLATKDCRCVALVYNSWGLTVSQDLAAVWNRTYGPAQYTVGVPDNGDIGLGLVCNLGSIPAGDSTVVSYAYVFNGPTGIDSSGAFPEPGVTIGGGPRVFPPAPYPNAVYDTFNACAAPGSIAVPVDLIYADDRAWTWSTWTWSPALGLSATTGTHVTVNTTVLPAIYTYTVTGSDPATCQSRTMYITFVTCNTLRANSPCYGQELDLRCMDSLPGTTYFWYGPGGFTSTQQNPVINPATYVDSGMFHCVITYLGVSDTDSIPVTVHYKPVVTATNNGPLCDSMTDTLQLNVGPGMAGMTYSWSGPPASSPFSSTVQAPTIPGYVDADTGLYTVIVASPFGCMDTATTYARMIPQPPTPIITDRNYCQGMPFVPFSVSGIIPGATVLWYPSPTGGSSITTAPTIPTSTVGLYYVYASQKLGSCESKRGKDSVRVVTTPPAPVVTGTMQYCQFIGPFTPLTVVPTTSSDSFRWYTSAAGGVGIYPEPVPNIGVVPPGGSYQYWVSLKDSGCEGPRTPVTITIHPKPNPPTPVPQWYCQYMIPQQVAATTSIAGDIEKWYGASVTTPGTTVAPYPNTSVAPDTIVYYVTETTVFGCVSDSATDPVIIRAQPAPPVTHDSRYCQTAQNTVPLNAFVDSVWNADSLKWYLNTIPLPGAPVPSTSSAPGYTTWYVSQWVNGCQSDSSAIKVQIVYKPVFGIWESSPWVCQYDSLKFSYAYGPALYQPSYYWTLPEGASTANGSTLIDSMITVKFDSANQNYFVVKLRAYDDSGFCYSDTSIKLTVIPQPTLTTYTKPDVCLGDTVLLALSTRASDAYTFNWYVDNSSMMASPAVNVITANSNSGGPFLISWTDTGKHVIKITTAAQQGCMSKPIYDSVLVHPAPDATFKVLTTNGVCVEDSVMFSANSVNYNYSYVWSPSDYFNNDNKPAIWGKMRNTKNVITLKVTDPYGCYSTASLPVDANSCCTLTFPNAFAPDAVGAAAADRVFQPIFPQGGYHRFHLFRIVNRWGQTVFESANNTDAQWDGRFNGVPQDMGTYYYYIKYDCGGDTFEQKGDVTLIR